MAVRETFNHFQKRKVRSNILQPDVFQACYDFFLRDNAPNGLKRSYTIDLEFDPHLSPEEYTALEAARKLLETYRAHYLFSTQANELEKLIEYLESVEEQDKIDELHYRIAEAEEKAEFWRKRANELREKLKMISEGDIINYEML
ncbi:MAG: hypothetical protein KM296_00215 [Brockia lithotrophica]|nr:hypothetical protein [Brockia lithotrophica]